MRHRESILYFGFSFILGLLLAILITAPSTILFKDYLIGYPHDGFEYIYKFWWFQKALFELGSSPAYTKFLNYPYIEYNLTIAAAPVLPLIAQIFLPVLTGSQTYNLFILMGLALSMACMTQLCFIVSNDRAAALLGGIIFAFNPNLIAHSIGGHLAQIINFPIIIFALLFLRFISNPTKNKVIILGILASVIILIDLKLSAYFFLPLLVLLTIAFFLKNKISLKHKLSTIAGLGVIIGLIIVPFFMPLLSSRASGKIDHFYQPGAQLHSAGVLSFFIPPPESFLVKIFPGFQEISQDIAYPGWHENVFFLGWATSLMAIAGGVFAWKQNRSYTKLWVVSLVTAAVFVLGPYLKFINDPISVNIGQWNFLLPMPYLLLSKLPFFDWGRTPSRFMSLLWFSLAILAALGFGRLHMVLGQKIIKIIVAFFIATIIILELNFSFPFPMYPLEAPQIFTQMAQDQEEYAILDLPLWDYRCGRLQQYYATLHNHPIVGGIITRRSLAAEKSMRNIEEILHYQKMEETSRVLIRKKIRYVILYLDCSQDQIPSELEELLQARLGTHIYRDNKIQVFQVY